MLGKRSIKSSSPSDLLASLNPHQSSAHSLGPASLAAFDPNTDQPFPVLACPAGTLAATEEGDRSVALLAVNLW